MDLLEDSIEKVSVVKWHLFDFCMELVVIHIGIE